MNKAPEEYFGDHAFHISGHNSLSESLSPAEQAFMRKYLGADAPMTLDRLGLSFDEYFEPEEHAPPIDPLAIAPDIAPLLLEERHVGRVQQTDQPTDLNRSAEAPVFDPAAYPPVEPQHLELPLAQSGILEPAPAAAVVEHEHSILAENSAGPELTPNDPEFMDKNQSTAEFTANKGPAPAEDAQPAELEKEAPEHLNTHTDSPAPPWKTASPEMAVSASQAAELQLRNEPEIQMVSFYIAQQEFIIPISAIQEVLRYTDPIRLPKESSGVLGVINTRGKITPLISMREILGIREARQHALEDCFVIVCLCRGLQIGLAVERIHTMYRAVQTDIDWNIETHLGINTDYVQGLLKLNDRLVSIVSVDRIVDYILK